LQAVSASSELYTTWLWWMSLKQVVSGTFELLQFFTEVHTYDELLVLAFPAQWLLLADDNHE
jgi:hypothetical protein